LLILCHIRSLSMVLRNVSMKGVFRVLGGVVIFPLHIVLLFAPGCLTKCRTLRTCVRVTLYFCTLSLVFDNIVTRRMFCMVSAVVIILLRIVLAPTSGNLT